MTRCLESFWNIYGLTYLILIAFMLVGCGETRKSPALMTPSTTSLTLTNPPASSLTLTNPPAPTLTSLPASTLTPAPSPTLTRSPVPPLPSLRADSSPTVLAKSLAKGVKLLVRLRGLPTDYSATELHPLDWSPSGKSLAYTQKDGVWLVQEPAYSPTRLVNLPKGTKRAVVWSPDGQHLAVYGDYWVEEDQLWGESIWLVKLGTSPQNLLDTIEPYAGKSVNQWLDDKRLTFNLWAGGGLQLLFQVDIESGQITPLLGEAEEQTDPPSIGGQYYWSPNKRQLAIQDCCFGRVILMDVQSGQKEPIGELPFQKFQGWMPTGGQFLYAQYEQGGVSVPTDPTLGLWLWELSADSGRKLLPQVYQAAPSPDGSQLAFLQREERLGQVPARIEAEINPENWPPALTLGLFSLTTGEITFLAPAGYKANEGSSNWEGGRPVWSPTGKLIAYWGEEGDVWLIESSGEWRQRLTEGLEIIDLVWSPDGGKLALRSFDEAWIIERPAKQDRNMMTR